jgi:hypothetical protein
LGGVMTPVLVGFGGGTLIGLRWKVLVLCPVTLLVAAFMIVTEGLSRHNAGLIVLVITAVQAGYICGVATRVIANRTFSADRTAGSGSPGLRRGNPRPC